MTTIVFPHATVLTPDGSDMSRLTADRPSYATIEAKMIVVEGSETIIEGKLTAAGASYASFV